MNKPSPTMHNLLSQWGQAHRQLELSQDIKQKILNALPAQVDTLTSPRSARRWWLSLTVGVSTLAILFLIILSSQYSARPQSESLQEQSTTSSLRMDQSAGNSFLEGLASKINPPTSPSSEIPITDTRQLLKTDYSATIRARQVQELTGRLQTLIRGYDGRIDSASSSPQYGSLAFVIPASKLDAFRAELVQLAGTRFTLETTSSQNLLPQKQALEESWSTINDKLKDATTQRDQLNTTHTQTVASLQAKLNANSKKLVVAQNEADRHQLQQERNVLTAQLSNENASYQNQLNSLNAQIQNLEQTLKDLEKQDSHLMDTVATVRGTITLSSINFWQYIGAYLPAYWPLYLAAVAAVIAYILHRRRSAFIL